MDGFRLELVRRLTIEIVDSTDKVLMVMMNGMISKASGIEMLNKHLKQLWQFSLLSKTKWTLESSAVSWPVSVSSCIITLYSLLTTYFVWMHPYIIVLLTHARSSSALVSDKRASQAPPQVSPSTPISRKCISHGPKCSLSHLTFGNKSLVWWQYVQSSYFDLLTLVFFLLGKASASHGTLEHVHNVSHWFLWLWWSDASYLSWHTLIMAETFLLPRFPFVNYHFLPSHTWAFISFSQFFIHISAEGTM